MKIEYLALLVFALILFADVTCYCLAKWPERMRHRRMLGSGFYSLYKYGKNKE